MLLFCLLLGTLTVPVTDQMGPYRHQPVLSIHVEAPGETDVEFLRSLIEEEITMFYLLHNPCFN